MADTIFNGSIKTGSDYDAIKMRSSAGVPGIDFKDIMLNLYQAPFKIAADMNKPGPMTIDILGISIEDKTSPGSIILINQALTTLQQMAETLQKINQSTRDLETNLAKGSG